MDCHEKELSVLFTDDSRMAELNHRYLGRTGPTNVLAFPMADTASSVDAVPEFETPLLGDIVISVDTAQREAAASGETLTAAVDRLLIHGLLHLLGHDHEVSEADALRMEKEQRRLKRLIEQGGE